jgi:hypothetical protein
MSNVFLFWIGDFRWVSTFSSLKIRSFHQSHGFQSETPLPSAATRSKGGFEVTSQSDSVRVPRGFLCADAGRLGGDVVCFWWGNEHVGTCSTKTYTTFVWMGMLCP